MRSCLIGSLILSLIGGLYLITAGEASIGVTAIDAENGSPITGATVTSGWEIPNPSGGWGSGPVKHLQGITDAAGYCRISIGSDNAYVQVDHPSYYNSGAYDKNSLKLTNPILALNHPEITVQLLRKLRPVPMYVRKIRADGIGRIPCLGQSCGFDLIRCAWVKPYGQGEIADFTVTASLAYRGEREYDFLCSITFADSRDGLLLMPRSQQNRSTSLRLPREAPANGFLPAWPIQGYLGKGPPIYARPDKGNDPGGKRSYEEDNFIFRVRTNAEVGGTEVASNGMYGKIHGPLTVEVLPWYPKAGQEMYLGLEFLYYLNPDGTTSLEWNGQNLFGELPPHERFTPEP
jgi:hypothetical protein